MNFSRLQITSLKVNDADSLVSYFANSAVYWWELRNLRNWKISILDSLISTPKHAVIWYWLCKTSWMEKLPAATEINEKKKPYFWLLLLTWNILSWIRIRYFYNITPSSMACDSSLMLDIYSKIPILRPPVRLSKSGLKDHFWTVPKVVSNQRYTGCRK